MMKNRKIFLFTQIILGGLLTSCNANESLMFDLKGLLNSLFASHDSSLYPNESSPKIEELKQRFLKEWRATDHCYVEYNPSYSKDKDVTWVYQPKELKFANVLHTVNYDTLVFFVSWYTEWKYLDDEYKKTLGQAFVIIDSASVWNFNCKGASMVFNDPVNNVNEHVKSLNEILIINSYYIKDDKTPDPTFWYRLFTDPSMWTTLRNENKKKSELLEKSKDEYLKYIENEEAH